mmetsp:Transcript_5327/g.14401  ORF Transcript_5327/g.14401 Transcript_5327/m.14401 type:complete len:235 (-) Transcript_5327:169-873(-)
MWRDVPLRARTAESTSQTAALRRIRAAASCGRCRCARGGRGVVRRWLLWFRSHGRLGFRWWWGRLWLFLDFRECWLWRHDLQLGLLLGFWLCLGWLVCGLHARITTELGGLLADAHLRSHVHLEVLDVALVLRDGLVVADPDLVGHLRNQPHIMRNQHHTTIEFVHCLGQCIDTFHVLLVSFVVVLRSPGQSIAIHCSPLQSSGKPQWHHRKINNQAALSEARKRKREQQSSEV